MLWEMEGREEAASRKGALEEAFFPWAALSGLCICTIQLNLLERLIGLLEKGLSALFHFIFLISPLGFCLVNTEEKYFSLSLLGNQQLLVKHFLGKKT